MSPEGRRTYNTGDICVQTESWTHATYQNSRKYKKEIQDRPLASNDSESVIKFTNQDKSPGPEDAALLNITKHLKK